MMGKPTEPPMTRVGSGLRRLGDACRVSCHLRMATRPSRVAAVPTALVSHPDLARISIEICRGRGDGEDPRVGEEHPRI